jgi:hypothetical protein
MGTGSGRARAIWLAVLASTMILACCTSSGDDGEGTGDAASEGVSASRRTQSTEPPGSEPEAVRSYVEALLTGYDDAVNAIITDPDVAHDRTDPTVQGYLEVFEPRSEFADGALAGWAELADAVVTVRPLRSDSPMIESRLDGQVETVGDDEVSFAMCSDHQYRRYDGQGALQNVVDMAGRAGEGTAVRVDGEWRLRRLELRDDRPACTTEEDRP